MVFFSASRWIAPVLLASASLTPAVFGMPSYPYSNSPALNKRGAVHEERALLPVCSLADLLDLKAALNLLGVDLGACVALGLDHKPYCTLPNCGTTCPSSTSTSPAAPTTTSTKPSTSTSTSVAPPAPTTTSTKPVTTTTAVVTKTSTSAAPTSTSVCDSQSALQVIATIQALNLKVQAILTVLDGKADPTNAIAQLAAAINETTTSLQGVDIHILICGKILSLILSILQAIITKLGLYGGAALKGLLGDLDAAIKGLLSLLVKGIQGLGPDLINALKGAIATLQGLGLTITAGLLGGLIGIHI